MSVHSRRGKNDKQDTLRKKIGLKMDYSFTLNTHWAKGFSNSAVSERGPGYAPSYGKNKTAQRLFYFKHL